MKLRALVFVSVGLALTLVAGCEKPSETDCKKAIANIRQQMGTAKMSAEGATDAAWVRSCRGTAKKKSVQCAINARSLEELKACGLLKAKEIDEMEALEKELDGMRGPAPVDAGVAVDAAAIDDGDAGAAADGDAGAAAAAGSAAPAAGSAPPPGAAAPAPAAGSGAPAPTTGAAAPAPAAGAAAPPPAGPAAPAPAAGSAAPKAPTTP
ncbi:MAG: hypothetical protein IPL61_04220 [Myxococcales bacterium]|nr:hypothetical protein [Myxococcales bacterium]